MDQQEYFTVQHSLAVNVEPLSRDFILPDEEGFKAEIPTPFLVASEFSNLDSITDKAIGELRNSDLSNVVQLLESQNSKLNLLLTFMLSQQNDPQYEHQTESFGASHFTYVTQNAPEQEQLLRIKLFIEHPASAVYCYGKVVKVDSDEKHTVTVAFEVMREEDQDILIKAALFQQQKLLRQRSLARDEKN
ncbi:PilZ domain-containing protein [Vibrio sp. SCSIO 43136]|uniref:PilZ domain-containing protein n=1 Tax=Vibrio sp. SCSIO 43136 TaxID=2819101 RepID=UPI002074FC7A|nr:PilZ domain-containing protein [Vibrio sp. SCSIO 43136]USD66203.1 PilZ domain-containing protein [Vibrio sp. SCSIO 43136]